MGLHSRRLVRVPMLIPVHHQTCQHWPRDHQNWAEQFKKVAGSDESSFLLHHGHVLVHMYHLPGKHLAPGYTMGSWQAGKGMRWTIFCLESLGPAIHVAVTLTCNTYLCIAVDHAHHLMETTLPDGCGLFQ